MVWLWSVVLVLGALPPLTDAQREQVAAGDDAREHNQPALYALLANVMQWEPDQTRGGAYPGGLVPGATVPDYGAIAADPAAYRGELFMVSGRYAGRERRMPLTRGGPWGEALTEWGVVADDGTVAMVYFVDPDATLQPPAEGARVRLVGRFFRQWSDVDGKGDATSYPVFVARAAERVSTAASGGGAGVTGAGAVIAAVVVLVGVLFWVRRMGGGRVSQRERVLARMRDEARQYEQDDASGQEAVEPPLPDDPAEALDAMTRRD